ncbi:beta-lactamase family protein [Daldinia decipiens]|uniref:beta-lactamase family protein n=1 Tax=Daldinia decipiens TaxID=326647 RepID=UPI0020C260D3|nr:beta-lactamase family protein [Daldinia decipiens]KAI1662591.1 beta-lactamase family protein [Daldinia decipiens]
MGFSEEAISELRSIIEQSIISGGESTASTVPGTVAVVVDRDGNELFAHSAGKRGIVSNEAMTLDNVFYLASCTKLIAGLACMQLVEKGELKLDDAAQVEELCPELKDIKVLKDDGTFEEKKKGITLKMLLTHTSGFSYSFFNETLRDWSLPIGIDEFSGDIKDILKIPLRFQPGEKWEYGIGIDWAGIVLQRKTGLTLNEYIQKNICQPLGLGNVNMIPTQSMKDNLAYMHQRLHDGKLIPRDHLLRRPLLVSTPQEIADTFNSGGAGLFAKPQEYTRVLAVLLNDGTCPKTGAKILEKATVEQMFTNQIPQFPDFGRQGIAAAKPHLTNAGAELYPVPGNAPQGWGLTFMLSGASPATGRSAKTAFWAGLPNLYWWADREHDVAGMVCTQIMPAFDPAVLGLWFQLEAAVYKHLKLAKA